MNDKSLKETRELSQQELDDININFETSVLILRKENSELREQLSKLTVENEKFVRLIEKVVDYFDAMLETNNRRDWLLMELIKLKE